MCPGRFEGLGFHKSTASSSFSLFTSLTLPTAPSQVGTCVLDRPAVSPEWELGVAEAPDPVPWGYIWTGSEGRTWDPVTLLLMKSTQTLLASGES